MNTFRNLMLALLAGLLACTPEPSSTGPSPAEILGNPNYPALSYGGHRHRDRTIISSVAELKEDMKILNAMGIRVIRTYNTELFAETERLLQAISELKAADPSFEMYVMLGIWIDCENAWTANPNHEAEDEAANQGEINKGMELANQYPDIVKVMAVGNEAMVHWAATYFVQPKVILKWVNVLREARDKGDLPKDIWITSSDNFASWGGEAAYHNDDLNALINAVDYVSMHTYPFHDTHYHADYWQTDAASNDSTEALAKAEAAMQRAVAHAQEQYQLVADYLKSQGIDKPIHIGETGWASASSGFYGPEGSNAADEYKTHLYYQHMRDWTNEAGISCFFFEGFDEPWKDDKDPMGSENHFGLITVDGKAKYTLWNMVDQGVFEGLTRGGNPITKTFDGDADALMQGVKAPPKKVDEELSDATDSAESDDLP